MSLQYANKALNFQILIRNGGDRIYSTNVTRLVWVQRQLKRTFVDSFRSLYTRAVGTFAPIEDVEAMQNDLKKHTASSNVKLDGLGVNPVWQHPAFVIISAQP